MKKTLALLLTLLMAAGVLSACGTPAASAPKAARQSLVLAEGNEWWGLDTTLLEGCCRIP